MSRWICLPFYPTRHAFNKIGIKEPNLPFMLTSRLNCCFGFGCFGPVVRRRTS